MNKHAFPFINVCITNIQIHIISCTSVYDVIFNCNIIKLNKLIYICIQTNVNVKTNKCKYICKLQI